MKAEEASEREREGVVLKQKRSKYQSSFRYEVAIDAIDFHVDRDYSSPYTRPSTFTFMKLCIFYWFILYFIFSFF